MKKAILTSIFAVFLCVAFWGWHAYHQKREVIMGPPWLLYSDEKLLQTFEHDALYGKEDVIRWNQILYERFYLGRGDFSKAKPFIDTAAELGDEAAKNILKDPNMYYRELKARCGEKVPDDFHLK